MIERVVRFTIPADTLDLEDDVELVYADELTPAEIEARIEEEFQDWLEARIELIRAAAECIISDDAVYQDMG